MLRNLIPKPNYSLIDTLLEQTISIFKGLGFRVGECGFSMGVRACGVEVGVFLWGYGWFHGMGSSGGSWVGVFLWVFWWGLGLRHMLLWFWVFGWPGGGGAGLENGNGSC